MAPPAPPARAGDYPSGFPPPALLGELESIPEPALIILPGGRIAAVNGAVRRSGIDPVGMTVIEFVGRFGARRADGRSLNPADLPYTRALRGERVDHGELFDGVLQNGTVYHARSSSTPIVVDGTVVAALSVWHNFPEELRKAVRRLKQQGAEGAVRTG